MADLGETLLRFLAPIQGAREEDVARHEDIAAKQKIADTAANSRVTVGSGHDTAMLAATGQTTAAARMKAMLDYAARLKVAQQEADVRLRTSPNDPEALKIKAATALAGPFMNQILAGNPAAPGYQGYVASQRFLLNKLAPGMNPEDVKSLQDFHAQVAGDNPAAPENFLDEISKDPNLQKMMQMDPNGAQAIQAALQAARKAQVPAAPGPISAQPAAQQPAAPAQTPLTPAPSTKPKHKIPVTRKSDGQPGLINPEDYDPSLYDAGHKK